METKQNFIIKQAFITIKSRASWCCVQRDTFVLTMKLALYIPLNSTGVGDNSFTWFSRSFCVSTYKLDVEIDTRALCILPLKCKYTILLQCICIEKGVQWKRKGGTTAVWKFNQLSYLCIYQFQACLMHFSLKFIHRVASFSLGLHLVKNYILVFGAGFLFTSVYTQGYAIFPSK